jgi:hypothetical protein
MKKMWNRVLSVVLAVVMVVGLFPVVEVSANFSGNGWSFVAATGTLTVTTNEGTTNWRTERGSSFQSADVKEITIGNSVTSIGEMAFIYCTSLEKEYTA